jgi:hypothetical protein
MAFSISLEGLSFPLKSINFAALFKDLMDTNFRDFTEFTNFTNFKDFTDFYSPRWRNW